jgi:predicted Zn-dependent protease
MSTITVPTAFAPTVRAPQVRLTRRGRAALLVVFLAVVLAAMTALGSWAAASRDAGTPEPVRIVEIQPGDTLYDIAGKVAAPGQVREMVAHIEQLNSLNGPELQVGQKIAVPRG